MKIAKKDILEVLKTITVPGEGQNMVESGAVTNVNIFGDEVIRFNYKQPSYKHEKN